MDRATDIARASERGRTIIRLHEHDEPVQRMLNALEPESYVRPHRHTRPHKHEVVVALRGSVLVVRFGEEGVPLEGYVVAAAGPAGGIEVPVGAWHTIVSLEPGTVVFEVNSGPYDPATHKEYALWAPPEEDRGAGAQYLLGLRTHFAALIPQLAARDLVEAEEDEIL
jgi:cupin fold WbuC family metalloprotein